MNKRYLTRRPQIQGLERRVVLDADAVVLVAPASVFIDEAKPIGEIVTLVDDSEVGIQIVKSEVELTDEANGETGSTLPDVEIGEAVTLPDGGERDGNVDPGFEIPDPDEAGVFIDDILLDADDNTDGRELNSAAASDAVEITVALWMVDVDGEVQENDLGVAVIDSEEPDKEPSDDDGVDDVLGNTDDRSDDTEYDEDDLVFITTTNLPWDINADNFVSPLDALLIIGAIRTNSANNAVIEVGDDGSNSNFDVSGDSVVSGLDALLVINYIARQSIDEVLQAAAIFANDRLAESRSTLVDEDALRRGSDALEPADQKLGIHDDGDASVDGVAKQAALDGVSGGLVDEDENKDASWGGLVDSVMESWIVD